MKRGVQQNESIGGGCTGRVVSVGGVLRTVFVESGRDVRGPEAGDRGHLAAPKRWSQQHYLIDLRAISLDGHNNTI